MPVGSPRIHNIYAVPKGFTIARDKVPGRYPLLEVFRGFEETVPFRKYPGDDREILKVANATTVHVVDSQGWMYVSPTRIPPEIRARGFKMETSSTDAIVVAKHHLTGSPDMDLYLDIVHEFLHILQRRQGRELWPGIKVQYVDRHTEIEAYSFSVAEARRLGIPDSYLREYLNVFWISRKDYNRLLKNIGVSTRDVMPKGKKVP